MKVGRNDQDIRGGSREFRWKGLSMYIQIIRITTALEFAQRSTMVTITCGRTLAFARRCVAYVQRKKIKGKLTS